MESEILRLRLQSFSPVVHIAKTEDGQRYLYPDEIILIKEILCTEFDSIFHGVK